MPDSEQMNPVLLHVESVNDAIVSNASAKTVRSFQPMVWKGSEVQSDFIDFRFNACTNSWRQLEKDRVETCVINLSRRAHAPWVTHSPALVPATIAALPPTRMAPAQSCSGSRT